MTLEIFWMLLLLVATLVVFAFELFAIEVTALALLAILLASGVIEWGWFMNQRVRLPVRALTCGVSAIDVRCQCVVSHMRFVCLFAIARPRRPRQRRSDVQV